MENKIKYACHDGYVDTPSKEKKYVDASEVAAFFNLKEGEWIPVYHTIGGTVAPNLEEGLKHLFPHDMKNTQ